MTTVQKIKEIEDEMAKTQKNKATSYHLGQLKAKLAKLRRELISPSGGGGGGGGGIGFDVARQNYSFDCPSVIHSTYIQDWHSFRWLCWLPFSWKSLFRHPSLYSAHHSIKP
ncbi:hypothetical protein E1B28_004469 [Marasmius oreades]|uniref:Developmentally regulated GTP binding protein 1 n=1 Tax=Marasmius oreades TaxID=181124 RepID=A0A9P7UYT8_9AGAR|nr:uncharacterized protein E1B28_004469 [Marasmius oreades]KAG7097083.1 hypothetical protein E1B28_004469 [Marasmius oreades]